MNAKVSKYKNIYFEKAKQYYYKTKRETIRNEKTVLGKNVRWQRKREEKNGTKL